ncbi:hypothetical protein [Prauserella muralis]|uniref:Uncharacterized protein n=1 Tax=Prauserella muralis TaxID=588067 RepID=A0A2V4B1F8_9PSEU|nr:hypothetical protein [Prauserella muralis]PXY27867.1 hypothetical protein BAY60_16005 [Prauserella muralis]TWE22363.1 hypothetical protein FHX69_3601 [Prauserella muralis]
MIEPDRMVSAIRAELAARVLPRLSDDRARSSVIAAMGILGDLALQIRQDDSWLPAAETALRSGIARWPVTVSGDADRSEILAATEELITGLWAAGEPEKELLQDIRSVLRADLEHQLKRIR